jgi:uncharacterized membrane protein
MVSVNRKRRINFDVVGRGLIFAGLGLGLMEVLMPGRIQRWIGVRRGDHSGLIRMIGMREIASAAAIFAQPRPASGVWTRVAGDAMDLGLLGTAFTQPKVKKNRLSTATAIIGAITALDVFTAVQLSRTRQEERQISALTNADLSGKARSGAFRVTRSVTINRSPEELYTFWRDFENLPQFMYHLESVSVKDNRRSHWVAKAPAGTQVAWDAEIVDDRPNEYISWQSTVEADVPNSGNVTFTRAPADQGTVVRVEIEYRPAGGRIGKAVAFLFGEEPGQQVKGDLGRFKQVMETGEVLRSDGSPAGLGQKMQRPARPMKDANKDAQDTRFVAVGRGEQEEEFNR